jgi:hypothetical protein
MMSVLYKGGNVVMVHKYSIVTVTLLVNLYFVCVKEDLLRVAKNVCVCVCAKEDLSRQLHDMCINLHTVTCFII